MSAQANSKTKLVDECHVQKSLPLTAYLKTVRTPTTVHRCRASLTDLIKFVARSRSVKCEKLVTHPPLGDYKEPSIHFDLDRLSDSWGEVTWN